MAALPPFVVLTGPVLPVSRLSDEEMRRINEGMEQYIYSFPLKPFIMYKSGERQASYTPAECREYIRSEDAEWDEYSDSVFTRKINEVVVYQHSSNRIGEFGDVFPGNLKVSQ